MHFQFRRLNGDHQRLGKPKGARRGFGARHIHQHGGHKIIGLRQINAGQKIIAVVAFGKGGRGLITGVPGKSVDGGPDSLALGKSLFYRQLETGIEAAYADAEKTMACNMMQHAALEGVQAFIDKRPPDWSAR